MAEKKLICDKTEIIGYTYMQNIDGTKMEEQRFELTFDKIIRIQFDKYDVRKLLFFKVPSEKILIVSKAASTRPYIFFKHKEPKHFEAYKQELSEFAKRNKVSLINNL